MPNKLRAALEAEWRDQRRRSRKGYSMKFPSGRGGASLGEYGVALARSVDVPVKPSHCMEICHYIMKRAGTTPQNGWTLDQAISFLEKVVAKEAHVPFVRYTGGAGHRRGAGCAAGKYPVKAAAHILQVLKDAESNALNTLSLEEPFLIVSLRASRGRTIQGWKPRAHGRSTPWDTHTTNIEAIIREAGEK